VLLDLMLPKRDGLEVLTALRRRGLQTPVLVLTAKDTVEDRVQGLDLGADDYLVKPFAFPELPSALRRPSRPTDNGLYVAYALPASWRASYVARRATDAWQNA